METGDRKHPVGTRVLVVSPLGPDHEATVVRHGRDVHGVYTEVRRDDGVIEQWHRSVLHTLPLTPAVAVSGSVRIAGRLNRER